MSAEFDKWWADEGSAMIPDPGEDFEEHAKRIARIAWDNGAYKATQPTDEGIAKAARALSDSVADECGIDREDNWKTYGDNFLADARIMLNAARMNLSITAVTDEKPSVEILQVILNGWRIADNGSRKPYTRSEDFHHILMDGDTFNFQLKVGK